METTVISSWGRGIEKPHDSDSFVGYRVDIHFRPPVPSVQFTSSKAVPMSLADLARRMFRRSVQAQRFAPPPPAE